MAPQTATSSIAMALAAAAAAGKTASVDIPKPRLGFPAGKHQPFSSRQEPSTMLLTPPNSISPTLPPHAFARHNLHPAHFPGSPSSVADHVDSDIDLHDAADDHHHHHHHRRQSLLGHDDPDSDSVGAITPAMLAKHHLPGILLADGPLAIRHVMGYLTTSVPGFSRIPPAKARRLVVAALEGRGHGSHDDGDGDVIFEKVGWGRWDARRRGQPARERPTTLSSPPSSMPAGTSHHPTTHMSIPGAVAWPKRGSVSTTYGTSMAGDSAIFSHSEAEYGLLEEDPSMLEHEADKMSLDGDDYCSSSEAPDDPLQNDEWDEGDVTDEEDWAQIGADALRARSLNGGGGFLGAHHHLQQPAPPPLRGGGPVASTLAKSAPRTALPGLQHPGYVLPEGLIGDKEERAAVEALLRLGSM